MRVEQTRLHVHGEELEDTLTEGKAEGQREMNFNRQRELRETEGEYGGSVKI